MNLPKISVIVPIYNVEKYLARCMDTLLNQTLTEIEIIMVDDGSPDNCPALCDAYAEKDNRVKVVHKKNGGLGFARNSGLEVSTGEFVAFIDSDDYVDTSMLEKLYNVAKRDLLDLVFCGFNDVDKNLDIHPIKEVEEFTVFNGRTQVDSIILSMIGNAPEAPADRRFQMSVWHAIYSKKIMDDYNIKFHSEREFISEDIIFHIDYLQKAQKVAFIPDSLYFYCANEVSLSASYRKDRFDRYKILHTELCRKLALIRLNHYELNVDRLFIGYVRSLIFNLKNYDMTNEERRSVVKEISSDVLWKKIIHRYPSYKMPFKYRVATYLITHNYFALLMIMSKIK